MSQTVVITKLDPRSWFRSDEYRKKMNVEHRRQCAWTAMQGFGPMDDKVKSVRFIRNLVLADLSQKKGEQQTNVPNEEPTEEDQNNLLKKDSSFRLFLRTQVDILSK